METRRTEHSVAIAVTGIVLSLLLAIPGASAARITIIATAASLTILFIYFRSLRQRVKDAVEERARNQLRQEDGVRSIGISEGDSRVLDLPSNVYGYEEIFALDGLRKWRTEHLARLKPDRTDPSGRPYPLEVQKLVADVYIVGFVAEADRQITEHPEACGQVVLCMRRTRWAPAIAKIPVGRVVDGWPRGDRNDSLARNIFRLELVLEKTGAVAGR